MTDYKVVKNEEFNSIELIFNEKPTLAEREVLKSLKFRWHSIKKVWYGYASEDDVKKALSGEKVKAEHKTKNTPVNKYGIKVGDVFTASWGYDQTNIDFFQVVELVGSEFVKVVDVIPEMETQNTYFMARDVKVKDHKGKMLPVNERSIFTGKGAIKRKVLNCSSNPNEPRPFIKVDSCVWAYKKEGTQTLYESWYA